MQISNFEFRNKKQAKDEVAGPGATEDLGMAAFNQGVLRMNIVTLPIGQLQAHPRNSNRMSPELFGKLKEHLKRSDRYPPIIVRRLPGEVADEQGESTQRYQLLDGHHRVAALRELGVAEARCVVWEVDDAGALELLATLNRLQGKDDPKARAALVEALRERCGLDMQALAERLPEDGEALEKLSRLHQPAPTLREPMKLGDMPVAVHFFLLPADRSKLEKALAASHEHRETALMQWVERAMNIRP